VPVNSRTAVEGILGVDINGYSELVGENKEILHKIGRIFGNAISY
jgi:hypothetical protein